jgi:hypothetical protein
MALVGKGFCCKSLTTLVWALEGMWKMEGRTVQWCSDLSQCPGLFSVAMAKARPFVCLFVCLFVLFYFDTGFLCSWLSWNSLCRPGWPRTQKSACLCLPSAGIKGVRHHAWLLHLINIGSISIFISPTLEYAISIKLSLNSGLRYSKIPLLGASFHLHKVKIKCLILTPTPHQTWSSWDLSLSVTGNKIPLFTHTRDLELFFFHMLYFCQ